LAAESQQELDLWMDVLNRASQAKTWNEQVFFFFFFFFFSSFSFSDFLLPTFCRKEFQHQMKKRKKKKRRKLK